MPQLLPVPLLPLLLPLLLLPLALSAGASSPPYPRTSSNSTIPPRRFGHSTVMTPLGLVVYGGYNYESTAPVKMAIEGRIFTYGAMREDVWRYVLATGMWTEVSISPPAAEGDDPGPGSRALHTATYDAASESMIVLGGVSSTFVGTTGTTSNIHTECGDDGMWMLPLNAGVLGGGKNATWVTLRASSPLTPQNCANWFKREEAKQRQAANVASAARPWSLLGRGAGIGGGERGVWGGGVGGGGRARVHVHVGDVGDVAAHTLVMSMMVMGAAYVAALR